ncbi:DUF1232 domain-containing protein [Chryseolinea sp. H1M3-3]|uniref:YkvA family protein n=1 Tax=Chryseolinea sp. H1M3-3 TaxID=3034144 RepID=UPI0023EB6B00|nr:DUF1232 domain-containing protein [Chryseolinea sp. H1M3-3]
MQANVLNNRFFEAALQKASRILGKPGRLILLLATLVRKLKQTDFTKADSALVKDKFFTLGRLLRAYARGEYRTVPWKSMVLIVAAILYFINPIDVIPDLLPIIGLSDDFAVLFMIYKSIGADIDRFLEWEKSKVIIIS